MNSGNCTNNGTCTTTTTAPGTTCAVNEITTPGCYVCNWNGALWRVGENCFDADGNCCTTFECSTPMTVTFLCDDPDCTTTEARALATTFCGTVRF